MNNSVLNYNLEEIDNIIVSDYTEVNYTNITDIPELSDTRFYQLYRMQNDEKIEGISQKLYGTSQYWDLLLLINEYDPLYNMSYSLDYLYEYANELTFDYLNSLNNMIYEEDFEKKFEENILDKLTEINEENRILKIIRPTRMQQFLKIARDGGYI